MEKKLLLNQPIKCNLNAKYEFKRYEIFHLPIKKILNKNLFAIVPILAYIDCYGGYEGHFYWYYYFPIG